MNSSENSSGSLQLSLKQAIADKDVDRVRNLVTQSSQMAYPSSRKISSPVRRTSASTSKINVNALLMASIKSGNIEILESVLQLSPEPNVQYILYYRDAKDKRCIHHAVETGSLQIVQKLLSVGTLTNVTDRDGHSPITIAASKGYVDIVERLIQREDRQKHACNGRTGDSVLHLAAGRGHLEVVKMLVKYGADINCQTPVRNGGLTVLHKAVLGGDIEVLKFLHQNGVNKRKPDAFGRCAFHMAAHKGNVNMLRVLLDMGADLEMRDKKQRTALCVAVLAQVSESVAFLLDRGADVSAVDGDGYQPLHRAAVTDRVDIVNMLLDYGADVNHMTKNKDFRSSPLMEACLARKPNVVQMLLAHGADTTKKDRRRKTALHMAQLKHVKDWSAQEELSLLLMRAGAPIDAKDEDAHTPLYDVLHNLCFEMKSEQDLDAVKMFVRHGARLETSFATVHHAYWNETFPLCWLTTHGFYETVRYLVLAGWDLKREKWLEDNDFPEHREMMMWLRSQANEPKPLMSMCREAIRTYFQGLTQGREILSKIAELPVPKRIISYLNLDDLL